MPELPLFDQKFCGPQIFWTSRAFFTHFFTKNILDPIFLDLTFLDQLFLDPTLFPPHIILDPKIFLEFWLKSKYFGHKNFLNPNSFWIKKIVWDQHFFYPNFFDQHFFDRYFYGSKLFQINFFTKTFFRPTQSLDLNILRFQNFGAQKLLDQKIILEPKELEFCFMISWIKTLLYPKFAYLFFTKNFIPFQINFKSRYESSLA